MNRKMQSGGIFRTIVITALFVVLVCDYTTLITQLYQSLSSNTNNGSRSMTIFGDDDESGSSDASFEMMQSPSSFREDRADLDLDAELDLKDLNLFGGRTRTDVISVVKNVCLPKLICELSAGSNQHKLTESESNLLKLIKDTTLGTLAEIPSKYHFAAHMGQLISGTDGVGCHLFYSTCPLPGLQVLKMMKRLKLK
ncbi:olfaction protein geko [Arctopsyche grandis]|uniref:olfaction protein geko n=1 Tax=Arctopsyche grandis TaxID=121162 RepID=UPI00406DA229